MNIDSLYRQAWVKVDLQRLKRNILILTSVVDTKYRIAVVKANAYGHGSIEVSQVAIDCGIDMLAVASMEEALKIRAVHDKVPILILGVIRTQDIYIAARHGFSVSAYSLNWLKNIRNYSGIPLRIHLKVDSGMSRLGLLDKEEIELADKLISNNSSLIKEGVYSHYYNAFNISSLRQQKSKFEFMTRGIDLTKYKFVHLSNSEGIQELCDISNSIRFGGAMYGLAHPVHIELKEPILQVFSLQCRISSVKFIDKAVSVGYDGEYITREGCYIATIPIGYGDGLSRKNQGRLVEVNGIHREIIGRVCMDQCMILVDNSVKEGDLVNIINDELNVSKVAVETNTINYDVTCSISNRVPRLYCGDFF